MADVIPLKVVVDAQGDTVGLAEYTPTDTVGLSDGGTGVTNATDAKTNLGLASVATTANYTELTNKPVVRIYRYDVTTAAVSWVIQHNKNTTSYQEKLFDSNGDRFYAYVETLDADSFKVHLSESITGHVEVFFDNDELLPPS